MIFVKNPPVFWPAKIKINVQLVVAPFQMAFLWLINGGDPNYSVLSGVILQVVGGFLKPI